jgi:hypothetical protein
MAENTKEISKNELLKVEIVESEKYVGSDWCVVAD